MPEIDYVHTFHSMIARGISLRVLEEDEIVSGTFGTSREIYMIDHSLSCLAAV